MKKLKLTIAALLLTMLSYSQAKDTTCYMIAGKQLMKFDYYKSEIIERDTFMSLKDITFDLNNKEYLVLDIYDDCSCVINKNFYKQRNIIVHYRSGKKSSFSNKSGDAILHFDGLKINKVIIKKPKTKDGNINLIFLKPYKT